MLIAACGSSKQAAPPAPEADPAEVATRAAAMLQNAPVMGSARDCTPADLKGGLGMTQNTLLALAHKPIAKDPEHADWINPTELDAPAARALLDQPASSPAARQAAAAWLAAPFYLVYRVDNVDAPLALGVKELKIGNVGGRVIRYEKSGQPGCVIVYNWQNDPKVSEQAIADSDKTLVDPKVEERVRADLRAQYLKVAPR